MSASVSGSGGSGPLFRSTGRDGTTTFEVDAPRLTRRQNKTRPIGRVGYASRPRRERFPPSSRPTTLPSSLFARLGQRFSPQASPFFPRAPIPGSSRRRSAVWPSRDRSSSAPTPQIPAKPRWRATLGMRTSARGRETRRRSRSKSRRRRRRRRWRKKKKKKKKRSNGKRAEAVEGGIRTRRGREGDGAVAEAAGTRERVKPGWLTRLPCPVEMPTV